MRRKTIACLGAFLLQQPHEHPQFAVVVDRAVELFDQIGGDLILRQIDPSGVVHKPVSEPLDLFGHRRRQQQRLTLARALFEDAFDIRPKADVEHSIRFVEDGNANVLEVEHAPTQQIEHTARRPQRNRRVLFQLGNLPVDRSSADQADRIAVVLGSESTRFGGHLFRQLPRRGEHDRLQVRRVVVDLFKNRDDEGGRLPGPGSRLSNAVLTGHRMRDEARLNRRRLLKSHALDGTQHFLAEAQFVKRLRLVGRRLDC